jgi:hypothetical protein
MCNVNRNYKNSVFNFLFSDPALLRELYSAIEGITLPPDIPIDINTLSDVLFMERTNDISFLIDNRLVVLIEHQSTICNNIPLRLLEYVVRVYEKITDSEKRYQENLMKIPKPEFIVLYNGRDEYPDYKELKLSDAFMDIEGLKLIGVDKIPLELIVQVYNINYGHNPEILKKSETLNGYSLLVDKIWEYAEKEDEKEKEKEKEKRLEKRHKEILKKRHKEILEKILPSVVKYCITNNILVDFLREHGSEVINMFYGEYDREVDIAVNRREAWEDGREEGLEQGRQHFLELLNQGLTTDEIKQRLNQEIF